MEGAFRIDALNRWQSILVKDGNVGGGGGVGEGPLPAFNLKIFIDNTLHVETFDGAGAFHNIVADNLMATGVWYKYAVVNDGATLSLFLDSSDGNGYVQQADTDPITGGALFNNDSVWAVGRGWFNGVNDFFDGQIDEVRISDTALARADFLFVPEPATWALMAISAVAVRGVRRRKAAA